MADIQALGRARHAFARRAWAESYRLLEGVDLEPFWTIVAEAEVEQIDDFFTFEQKLMANETLRKTMADYHDLVESGRREIYRIES